ncbi:MAG: hypothetical protein QOF78_1480 [Phycisphaerales bacterium]|jgi:hypothetical protein|nr:hypothetical protein [Phycisphaerales bacterium]
MKRNKIAIAVLSLTAALLVTAHVLVQPADAQAVIKERDYQVVTAKIQTGGDGLYIMDSRTGQVAVFTYDPASRGVRARTVRNVADAFQMGR